MSWSALAAIHTILRFCELSSDLFVAESLYRRTALEDLLGVPADKVNESRVYRALDHILPHKETVEEHLRDRLGKLFDLDYDILLYDVTSTFFEGLAARNPQAKRGYSRDHRPDCKQVCVALVVARGGVPLGYEVFDGNRVEVTTVRDIATTMESRFGAARRVWVMDRGMASEANVRFLREEGRRYLIGASKFEEESTLDSNGVAPSRGSGQGAPLRLLPCLRDVKDSRALAGTGRDWEQPSNAARRVP